MPAADNTAVPGAGDLLGNLLRAVAGSLDRGGPPQGIAAVLNRLVSGLGLCHRDAHPRPRRRVPTGGAGGAAVVA